MIIFQGRLRKILGVIRDDHARSKEMLLRISSVCLQDFVRVAARSHIGLKLAKTWKPTHGKKRLTKRNVVLHFLQDDFQKNELHLEMPKLPPGNTNAWKMFLPSALLETLART